MDPSDADAVHVDPGDAGAGGAADKAGDLAEPAEFVLPLVIRLERASPPERTDALEAAARAVLTLVTDSRAVRGEWAEPVHAWQAGRIRKVIRRARGSSWQRVLALPGMTVTQRTAQLRVHPPVPVDGWPADLARLQVGGTELHDSHQPPEPPLHTPVLWLNPGLRMTAGKAMAQAGHAAQLAWWRLPAAGRAGWAAGGFALAVRTAPASRWPALVASGLPVVKDAGFTEVAPGSCTVVADIPALRGIP